MNTLCNSIKHYGPLIARILLAQLFIISGFGKIKAFGGTAAYMVGKGGMLYVMVYGAGPFSLGSDRCVPPRAP